MLDLNEVSIFQEPLELNYGSNKGEERVSFEEEEQTREERMFIRKKDEDFRRS